MKKLILTIAIAIALTSCTADPIEMRTSNPQMGVNVTGSKFMVVRNENDVQTKVSPETKSIQYNPTTNVLLIDDKPYEVVETTHNTITYEFYELYYVIEFNTGYVWQDGNTQTKFDMYQLGDKNEYYTVYTYNN